MPLTPIHYLQSQVERGALSLRDIDAIMVATGSLTRESIDAYIAHRKGVAAPPPGLPSDGPTVAREVTERICGCQFQDGGGTQLIAADAARVHLRVTGTCVHCPQIRYTMDVLARAIRFRAPSVREVGIDGTQFDVRMELPVNRQLTLAMLLDETGLTLADIDEELERLGRLTDEDVMRLGHAALHRRESSSA